MSVCLPVRQFASFVCLAFGLVKNSPFVSVASFLGFLSVLASNITLYFWVFLSEAHSGETKRQTEMCKANGLENARLLRRLCYIVHEVVS